MNDPTGTYAFAYDNIPAGYKYSPHPMGRPIGMTTSYSFLTSRSFTNAYTYDAASNRTGFTDPENGSTAYSYDTLNRLSSLAPPSAFGSGSFGFSYDALSRRTQMTRPNSVTTNYTYDNLSRLTSVLHQLSGSTIDGASYTLDSAGNRTAKTDHLANGTSNYTYDAIYQLTQVTQANNTTESYAYDAVGNRTASLGVSLYTTNASNELTATSNASYTYDSNGNTLAKTVGSNTTTYAWDYENRLTSVTLPGTGGTVTFKYDPFGRRIEKTTSSATSIYAFDDDNLIEEVNSSGTVVARYSQGQNVDESLAMLRSSATSYYNADGLGSVTSLTNSAGATAETYTYDSFGNVTASSGSLTNPFQYTGRESDVETGLYYYRARYYDPQTGRFLSQDPWDQGPNLYIYVENDPTNFVDPLGLYIIAPPQPGHPVTPPPSPALDKLLKCIEDLLHISLTVTSTTEGTHQDPGHAAGTSVDLRPPPGVSPNAVFCAAGQCGAKWVINEDTSHGGQTTPKTTAPNYHLQLFPPHHPSPKAPNAIPPSCVPPAPSPGPGPGPSPGASCSNSK